MRASMEVSVFTVELSRTRLVEQLQWMYYNAVLHICHVTWSLCAPMADQVAVNVERWAILGRYS